MPTPPSLTTISLVHATYFSEKTPREIRKMWLLSAEHPDRVDYAVAMDESDSLAREGSRGLKRVVSSDTIDRPSTVRNWNAAAKLADGDLIVVIADDLIPEPGWDSHLTAAMGALNPAKVPFGIKLGDSPKSNDTLLRHPVISRAWFRKEGLFDPRFDGVYCDNDITNRLYTRAFIIDGSALPIVNHRHPQVDRSTKRSRSHKRQNEPLAYQKGKAVLDDIWPAWASPGVIRMVPAGPHRAPLRSFGPLRPTIILYEQVVKAPGRWKRKYLLAVWHRLKRLVMLRR